jgi:hypothetical protein
MRGGGVYGVSANEYSCVHGAQINFRDLTPYLTYAIHTQDKMRGPLGEVIGVDIDYVAADGLGGCESQG